MGGGPDSIDQPMTKDLSYSLTGRQSNGVWDVRPVDILMVVETARLPEVIDELTRENFFTVLDVSLTPVDSFAALAEGCYYGSAPVSDVALRLETVWFRSLHQDRSKATAAGSTDEFDAGVGLKSLGGCLPICGRRWVFLSPTRWEIRVWMVEWRVQDRRVGGWPPRCIMKTKGITVVERFIEKGILGLAAFFAVAFAAMQLLSEAPTTKAAGGKSTPEPSTLGWRSKPAASKPRLKWKVCPRA